MFETAKPVPQAQDTRFSGKDALGDDLQIGSIDSVPGEAVEGVDSLRMMEWGELTARLNAARDLRIMLRRDANKAVAGNTGSFADAAARYFRTRDENEPDVNPVALEQFKGSPGMIQKRDELRTQEACQKGHAAKGDARDY